MSLRRCFAYILLFCIAVVSGCGQSANPVAPARVSGKLTYKNQPIKGGNMRLYAADGSSYDAIISSDGTYSSTNAPTGEVVVTVETESINPHKTAPKSAEAQMRMKAMDMSSRRPGSQGPEVKPTDNYIKIPEKYSNPKTSPLTLTLKNGRQVHDIDLTD